MKKFIRILSLLLAIVMLASCFVACNDEPDEKESESQTTTDSTPDTEVGASKLPEMDLGGITYTVLGGDHPDWVHLDNFEIAYDELPEDVVGQAVYNRNQKLKNDYNFTVVQTLAASTAETAKVALESGDDLYDLVLYKPVTVQAHAQEGYLLDLNKVKYIDLDHESWSQNINDQLTIGDKLYYTTNDFLLLDKARVFYLYYNRELARDLNLGYFEDLVDNNQWTLEEMTKIAKQAYRDLDNNGPSYTDQFGLGFETKFQFVTVAASAGFRVTEIDNVGYPKLVGATDKMLNILDATLDLTADHTITWCQATMGLTGNDQNHPETIWLDGRMLFVSAFATFIEYNYKVRESTIEYGVLPNPKYETTQDNYYSYPDIGHGSILAIPYTVSDEDVAGFCLEAITEASTDTTYITYIETKCQYQEATDADCARMLALCFENQAYDIGAFLFSDRGELYNNLTERMQESPSASIYKRLFDSQSKACQSEIDELIENYSKR